jgi:hypothetical protein
MRGIPGAVLAVVLLAAPGAHAQSQPGGAPLEVKPSGTPGTAVADRTLRMTATVYAVDASSRILTLQNDMGGTETMKVGPAVKDLARFAPGDTVVVELVQGLALELQPPGAEFVPPTAIPAETAPGPGAVAAGGQIVRSTVTVAAIDLGRRLVTLTTPGGKVYRVKAGPGIQLEKLKVGDSLVATYLEAVAVTLEKAGSGAK